MMGKAKERHSGFLQRRTTVLQAPELVSAPLRICLGKSTVIRIRHSSPEEQIQAFFQTCLADGTLDRLRSLSTDETGLLGLNTCFTDEKYRYTLAVFTSEETIVPDGLERIAIDPGDFAQFSLNGVSCCDAWREIYNHWLPQAPYRYRIAQELEVYQELGPFYADALWVPIQQREYTQMGEHRDASARPGVGELLSAALFGTIGLLFSLERGNSWMYALPCAAAGYLLFVLFRRLKAR